MSGDDLSFTELLSMSPTMTWTGDGALDALNAGLPPGHYGDDAPPARSPPAVVTGVDPSTGTITLEPRRGSDTRALAAAIRRSYPDGPGALSRLALRDDRCSFADLVERELAAALAYLDERDDALDRFGYGARRWTWRFARRLFAAIGAL